MPYCRVQNADMYYEEVGEGTPIVLVHGFTPDHRLMSGCMEPIFQERTGFRRIYLDLPGMGKTRDYERIANSDDMLEAVISLIDSLIPGQSYLIAGESYGGYLARGLIAKHKERVLGAAFICPMILPRKEDRTLPAHAILQQDDAFMDTLTAEEAADFASIQVVLNESNWVRYKQEIVSGCALADESFLDKIRQAYGFSYAIDTVPYEKPSLFIMGKQDSAVGYKDAYALLDNYPRGTFAALDKAGHNLQIEQPVVFNALVNEWLDRVETSI